MIIPYLDLIIGYYFLPKITKAILNVYAVLNLILKKGDGMPNRVVLRKKKRKMIIILFLTFFLTLFLNFKIRPVIKSSASNRARVIVSQTVGEAVLKDMSENKENYSEIIMASKNDVGEVISLTSNMEKVNSIKSRIALIVQEKLCNLKAKDISVPIGTLSGIEFLNCRGPSVPLKISVSGNIQTDLKSDFWGAGINQTLHRINLIVHMKVSVIVPGCSCVFESDNKVLVAETVIVGRVPNLYGGNVTSGAVGGETSG